MLFNKIKEFQKNSDRRSIVVRTIGRHKVGKNNETTLLRFVTMCLCYFVPE